MYLKELIIKNFRGIEHLELEFQKGLNVIIGENNTGKTAVIDALRLVYSIGTPRREIYVKNLLLKSKIFVITILADWSSHNANINNRRICSISTL